MLFHVSSALEYAIGFPSTLILNVHAQRSGSQKILEEHFAVEPRMEVSEFTPDGSDNRFVRLETGRHKKVSITYAASVECDYQTYAARSVEATPVAALDGSTIPYLFPSRYCQSDRLSRLAWDLFGAIENPHQKVVQISDWVHENVEYLRGSTDSLTSAYDTVTQRTGVCRDFAHLCIALCRALNIQARYFAGNAYQLEPPDFHACFECFIGRSWVVFDATRLAHLNGLVRV
jgi:transglutaminase-like putative cysteine protease